MFREWMTCTLFHLTGLFAISYYVLLVLICTPLCYVQLKLGALYKRGIVGIFSQILPLYK
ncbi:sodium-dependent serotonin transporter, partial [Biomphalaria glabrata]